MPTTQEKKIRIAQVITRLELGGAQQVVLHTLKGLDPQRYERFLIAGQGGLLDDEARRLDGVRVELWRSLKHPIHPLWDLVAWSRLAGWLRRNRIDIVHTHSSKAGILGRLAAVRAGVKAVVHTVHGWPFHDRQPEWVRGTYVQLERLAACRTNRLIAVSQMTKDLGLRHRVGRPEQYEVIYPGSDLEAFKPATAGQRREVREEFGFPADCQLVGMVACLKPQKAPVDFIRAVNEVRAPEARFLIVGDGSERQAVEREIRRLKLEGRVTLAGWRRDVPRLLPAFDVLALTSLWEGLPCVLAQAMASAVAVAATDVGGSREALADGANGRLVPAGNPRAMAQALSELLSRPDERSRLAAAGPGRAEAFTISTMVQRLDRLYRLLAERIS
ncbi:MAG: glycosyltransferase family 4 protein [candidate division FCPU426 bacterium]